MPSSTVCWGIEIGAGAIKALKLEKTAAGVRVADFAVMPHAKPLSTPDASPADVLRVTLGTFAGQFQRGGASVAISVPGHSAFARFAKLPPVEPKKVPDIVKFEAVQQIPFPIEQVEWDYQTFQAPDSPDVEVGIFAITRERVLERLAGLQEVGITPDVVALSPVAVYNALAYDLQFTDRTPGTIILDIGNVSTDLIVADAGRVWIRTFPLGGHHFTECLASAFKAPYAKAEKLKREIDQSQHKRQLFQALRPVFEDLGQDVQRSIAYYQQLHPEAKLTRLVGLGASFGLPGLKKYLTQRLGMDVVRLEQFQRIGIEGVNAAEFQASAHTLATAYGCALQGLGLAPIDANLVPVSVVRDAMWKRKTKWFVAAAGVSVAAGAASFIRPMLDARTIPGPQAQAQQAVSGAVNQGNRLKQAWESVAGSAKVGFAIANVERMFDDKGVVARVVQDVGEMLASAGPQPELLAPGTPEIPPGKWNLFELRSLRLEGPGLSGGVALASGQAEDTGRGGRVRPGQQPGGEEGGGGDPFGGGGGRGGPGGGGGSAAAPLTTATVTLVVDSPNEGSVRFVNDTLLKWLRANAERPGVPYRIVLEEGPTPFRSEVVRAAASAAAAGGAESEAGSAPAGGAGGGGAGSGVQSSAVTAEGLDAAAPLTLAEWQWPASAEVRRYTLRWKIEVLPPGAAAPAGGEVESSAMREAGQ